MPNPALVSSKCMKPIPALTPGIPSWLAGLLGILLESILYGFFLLLYLINLIATNREKTVPLFRQRMIQVSTLMLALSTAHLIIAFVRLVHGYTPTDGQIDSTVFGILYDPFYRAKIAIYFMQTILADAIMTWRCFVIYGKLRWVLFPGGLAILLDVATLVVRLLPGPQFSDSQGINGLIPLGMRIAFLSTTMTLHFGGSAAIVVKIYLTRRSIQHTTRNLSPIIVAVIESAAIYTISVFFLLLCNILNSFAQFIVMDIIIPLVGVVFCLIAIRIRFYLKATPASCEHVEGGISTNPWTLPAPIKTVADNYYYQ